MIYILNAIQTVKSSTYTWILRYRGKNLNTTYSAEGSQRASQRQYGRDETNDAHLIDLW